MLTHENVLTFTGIMGTQKYTYHSLTGMENLAGSESAAVFLLE